MATKTAEVDTLQEQIVKLRNEGHKWADIADAVGVPPGKCMLEYDRATIPARDRVKNATPEKIVELRDSGLSWGKIMAMTGLPETKARSMYTEGSGIDTLGHRIGKGGRFPGNGQDADGQRVKPAKGTTKKTVAPSAAVVALTELVDADDLEGVQNAITGRALKLADGEVVKIRSVRAVKNGAVLVVNDETSKARVLKLANIVGISKRAVVKAAAKE